MAVYFLGQIQMFAFDFAPKTWAKCDGQLISIASNSALFSLLGTTYGGNGVNNFALPDLRGRSPLHWGQGPGLSNYVEGQVGGVEAVTLTQSQLPQHNHTVSANTGTPTAGPVTGNFWAQGKYSSSGNAAMLPGAVGIAGSTQPHNNLQPYLTVNFCICLNGLFPSRN